MTVPLLSFRPAFVLVIFVLSVFFSSLTLQYFSAFSDLLWLLRASDRNERYLLIIQFPNRRHDPTRPDPIVTNHKKNVVGPLVLENMCLLARKALNKTLYTGVIVIVF